MIKEKPMYLVSDTKSGRSVFVCAWSQHIIVVQGQLDIFIPASVVVLYSLMRRNISG